MVFSYRRNMILGVLRVRHGMIKKLFSFSGAIGASQRSIISICALYGKPLSRLYEASVISVIFLFGI